jgi:hypothetical protein
MPALNLWIALHHCLHVRKKVRLSASGAAKRLHNLTARHITRDNERTSAMSDVLKLSAFHLAWGQRQARVFAFQSLHSSQFIGAHHLLALLCQNWGLSVKAAYVSNFLIKVLILRWG